MLKSVLMALAAITLLSACTSTDLGFSVAEQRRAEQLSLTGPPPERPRIATEEDRVQIDCLARNIYFEARGEPVEGQEAVAHVTLNRVYSGQFPSTVCGVVYDSNRRGCQFSWTCDGYSDRIRDRETFQRIQQLAESFFLNTPPDNTFGALFYHADYVRPSWSRVFEQTTMIGAHIFYTS